MPRQNASSRLTFETQPGLHMCFWDAVFFVVFVSAQRLAARQLPTENIDQCLIGKDNGRKKRYVSVG